MTKEEKREARLKYFATHHLSVRGTVTILLMLAIAYIAIGVVFNPPMWWVID